MAHAGNAPRATPSGLYPYPTRATLLSVMATTATMRSHATAPARLSARGALGSSGQLSKTRAATRNARRAVTRATGAPPRAPRSERRPTRSPRRISWPTSSPAASPNPSGGASPLFAPPSLSLFRDLLILAAAKARGMTYEHPRPAPRRDAPSDDRSTRTALHRTQDRHRAREVRVPAREPPPHGVRRARRQAPQRPGGQVRLGAHHGVGNIIGCKLNSQSVTLEPGGQFELSGAPLANLHQTCAEVHSHLYQIKTVAKEIGVSFLGLGFQPKWSVADTP